MKFYKRVKLYELLQSLTDALDMVSPQLANHHKRVAYLSLRLAKELNFSPEQQRDVFFAALTHDIGVLSLNERLQILENETSDINNHGFKGAKIIADFPPLAQAAKIIKYHHLPWNYGKGLFFGQEEVPYASHIVHLADCVCGMINSGKYIIDQVKHIQIKINGQCGVVFDPVAVKAFNELALKEYIWLELMSDDPLKKIGDKKIFNNILLNLRQLTEITNIFSKVVDLQSRFTALHSAGVANTAQKLAELMGFSKRKSQMMLIAGYLHDLGKLAVDKSLLEKNGKLSEEEFNKIRCHTYYTYQLLDRVKHLDEIKTWAAFHHEKVNGNGYPFHIQGHLLPKGAKIMAVADVFTAIKEDRPYRAGMSDSDVIATLAGMVVNGSLDKKIVNTLIKNINSIKNLLENTGEKVKAYYNDFNNSIIKQETYIAAE